MRALSERAAAQDAFRRPDPTAAAAITPDIRAHVRQIELKTRRLVESLFSGEYHSVFKGRGLEFADVREYTPGDDVRAIDWNVTARRGHPFVKEFVEERQLNVLLIVDVSASHEFGTGFARNARIAAEIAAILGLAASHNNDHVGMLLVSDRIERFIPPDTGRRHSTRLVLELLTHEPTSTGTRLSTGLELALKVLRQRSVIFIVSDFLLDESRDAGLERALRHLTSEHDVIPVRLTDPAAGALPDLGRLALRDPESGLRTVVNTSDPAVRERHRARHEQEHERLGRLLRRLRLDVVEVRTNEDHVQPLVALFQRRARVGA